MGKEEVDSKLLTSSYRFLPTTRLSFSYQNLVLMHGGDSLLSKLCVCNTIIEYIYPFCLCRVWYHPSIHPSIPLPNPTKPPQPNSNASEMSTGPDWSNTFLAPCRNPSSAKIGENVCMHALYMESPKKGQEKCVKHIYIERRRREKVKR